MSRPLNADDERAQARLALDAIGQMPDSELDLAGAALQLARIDAPEADWKAARDHLSELARDAVAVAADRPGDDPAVRAGALAGLMDGRWHYAGDRDSYDDPANANLIRVIERRRGLPVALGILWLHCARAAGWEVFGVDFPGHFMLALPGRKGQLILDVFAGGQPADARSLCALIKRVEGPKAELRPGLLAPMAARSVLLRLQNNIRARRFDAGDTAGGLTVLEDMLRIAPDFAALWREAAVVNQRLDCVGAALRCYERFLDLVPEGEAASRVRLTVDKLRTRLN